MLNVAIYAAQTSVVNSRQMATDLELGAWQGFVSQNYKHWSARPMHHTAVQILRAVSCRDRPVLFYFLGILLKFLLNKANVTKL